MCIRDRFIPVPPNTSFAKITENAVATARIHNGQSTGTIIGIRDVYKRQVCINFHSEAFSNTGYIATYVSVSMDTQFLAH